MKIRNCVSKVKGYIFLQVVLSLLATVAIAFIPVCNKVLVDSFFMGDKSNFLLLAGAYIVIFLVYLLATWGSERFVWKSAILFENVLKKECYATILKLRYSEYVKKK